MSFGGSPCWISSAAGEIPPEAVSGGQDGEVHFVARARHEGALLPGKLVPSHGVTYVAWGGGEHPHDTYEVLCGCSARWFPVSGDAIPAEAMPAGETEDGEPLFVGRVSHEGSVTIGKVHVMSYFLKKSILASTNRFFSLSAIAWKTLHPIRWTGAGLRGLRNPCHPLICALP